MQLVEPTDFDILGYLQSNGRNNAVNLAVALDRERTYMNTRLRTLCELGCTQRVGPAKNSGLYEITSVGVAALQYRSANKDPDVDFLELIHEAAEASPDESVQ
ncbi:winged helix-turn-helix domain-containing protein [Haloferax namakaokahaiae]|uniref:Winged helix-turn-helix domain-containing protein n=1 Tax=Haloferax namakaokahaiae TaxID=1748331 RepID=A0ABD5ZBM9_9EURY